MDPPPRTAPPLKAKNRVNQSSRACLPRRPETPDPPPPPADRAILRILNHAMPPDCAEKRNLMSGGVGRIAAE